MSKLRTLPTGTGREAPSGAGGPPGDTPPSGLAARALRDSLALLAFVHDLADEPLSALEVQGLLILVEGRLRRNLAAVEQGEASRLSPV